MQSSSHRNRLMMRRGTGGSLVIGFAALLILMALLVIVALSNMAAITARLELVVHNHNVKRELVEIMYLSSRERLYGLQKMLLLKDPFDRDDEIQRFNRFGTEFAAARETLLVFGIDVHEQMALDEQGRLAQQLVPIQREVIRLIIDERLVHAQQQLLNEVMPLQEDMLRTLERLRALHGEATSTATSEALAAQQYGRQLLLMLGAGALLLAALIAALTIHRVRLTSRQLATEKERVEITLHTLGDGVISTDASGRVECINSAAQRLTGWRDEQALQQPLLAVLQLRDRRQQQPLMGRSSELLDIGHGSALLRRHDGRQLAVEFTASELPAADGQHDGLVVVFRDISELTKLAEQLDYQARHDALTGLCNRSEFERRLGDALETAQRGRLTYGLLYLDLDKFKVVNDTCGHAAGDELLRQLVCEMGVELRSEDILARLGGDEFGVLLDQTSLAHTLAVAERLRQRVAQFQFTWDEKCFHVGLSIGLVMVEHDSGTLAELLNAADTACYIAKEQGRGRVHQYRGSGVDSATEQRLPGRVPWPERLQQALVEDRFLLHAQPIQALNSATHQARYELLLRMCDEQGVERLPSAFLPAAERSGIVESLDLWAVRHLLAWLRPQPSNTYIYSFNLSAQSLLSRRFSGQLAELLQESGRFGRQICFELQETVVLANLTAARRFADQIRRYGCRIVLDDFGSALSSFAQLRQLQADMLKINGRLILRLQDDPVNPALIAAINQIAHVLGTRTTAKFVENERTRQQLQSLGTDFAQGYGIAVPRPLAELTAPPLAAVS